MQDSTLPSAPNKLISSALGQVGRIHFTRSILTQSMLSLPCAICNMAFIQAVIRVLVHCEGSIRSHSIHTHCFIYLNVWLLTHTSPVWFPGRQINCCCCPWMRCFAKHRHKYMRIRKFHTMTCLTDWENLKRSGGWMVESYWIQETRVCVQWNQMSPIFFSTQPHCNLMLFHVNHAL